MIATSRAGLTSRRVAQIQSSPIRDLLAQARAPGMISLAGGLPTADGFDVEGVEQAVAAAMREPHHALQYGLTEGEPRLREALCALMASRGIISGIDSVLVTGGSQQGIDLVARLLLDPDDIVVVERPSYLAAVSVFRLVTDNLEGVGRDAEGPDMAALDALIAAGRRPRMMYLVPDFANPTGHTMSLARRRAILQWAAQHQVMIVEDDPYSELRFEGERVPGLFCLAQDEPLWQPWVIHMSTLSKVVAPGLRLGWMVLPAALYRPAVLLKQGMDLHTGTLTQLAAAHYLESGRLAGRLTLLRGYYRERRDALRDALQTQAGDLLQINTPGGGMFLWARLTEAAATGKGGEALSATDLLTRALAQGVAFVPGAAFYDSTPDPRALRLSFSGPQVSEMPEAVARLVRALR